MKTTLQVPGKKGALAARVRLYTPNADARIFKITEALCTENAVLCLGLSAIPAMEKQAQGTSRRTVREQSGQRLPTMTSFKWIPREVHKHVRIDQTSTSCRDSGVPRQPPYKREWKKSSTLARPSCDASLGSGQNS